MKNFAISTAANRSSPLAASGIIASSRSSSVNVGVGDGLGDGDDVVTTGVTLGTGSAGAVHPESTPAPTTKPDTPATMRRIMPANIPAPARARISKSCAVEMRRTDAGTSGRKTQRTQE